MNVRFRQILICEVSDVFECEVPSGLEGAALEDAVRRASWKDVPDQAALQTITECDDGSHGAEIEMILETNDETTFADEISLTPLGIEKKAQLVLDSILTILRNSEDWNTDTFQEITLVLDAHGYDYESENA